MKKGQSFRSYRLPVENREFTAHQRNIARLMATGVSNIEIAKHFGVTYCCIKNTIKRINDKSGMSSRLEFAMWYWHHFPEELELKRTAETVLRTEAVSDS